MTIDCTKWKYVELCKKGKYLSIIKVCQLCLFWIPKLKSAHCGVPIKSCIQSNYFGVKIKKHMDMMKKWWRYKLILSLNRNKKKYSERVIISLKEYRELKRSDLYFKYIGYSLTVKMTHKKWIFFFFLVKGEWLKTLL